jgi:hypothetical protein
MEAEILAAMSRANVPPEVAYAYRKTGLLGLLEERVSGRRSTSKKRMERCG